MSEIDQSWRIGRDIHLGGGVRAIHVGSNCVQVTPVATNGLNPKFDSKSFDLTFSELEFLGFNVIGAEIYEWVDEFEGLIPPKWFIVNKQGSNRWNYDGADKIWSGISHAAFKEKEGHIWDVSSKISHQLKVCSQRLLEISNSYHNQLIARCKKDTIRPNQGFEDLFTWRIYLATQSYLVDACILRDYLAEFCSAFIFAKKYSIDCESVCAFSGLIKKVLKNEVANDPLANELRSVSAEDGWLKILGDYRDLAVHSAPLVQAEKRLYALSHFIPIESDVCVPSVKIPLPSKPGSISASRASRSHFRDFEEQLDRYNDAIKNPHEAIDALAYTHDVHTNLAKLSIRVSMYSPIKYRPIVLTDKDVISLQITKG